MTRPGKFQPQMGLEPRIFRSRGGCLDLRATKIRKKHAALSAHQIIIDECAMSTEPHSLAPIIATQAKQVVLIGDHQQLRPVVTCQPAVERGLDQSLFQRLYNQFPECAAFLRFQYRMVSSNTVLVCFAIFVSGTKADNKLSYAV